MEQGVTPPQQYEYRDTPWVRGGAANPKIKVPTPETDWEHQEFLAWLETPRSQRSAIDIARRLGNIRTAAGVRPDIAGTSRMYISRQMERYDWVARARSYDLTYYAQEEHEAPLARADMNIRHSKASSQMIDTLMRPVKAFLERIQELEADGVDWARGVPVEDLFEMVVKASRALPNLVKAERLARGESTDNVIIDIEARLRRLARERGLDPDEVVDAARRTWRPGGDEMIPSPTRYLTETVSQAGGVGIDPLAVYFPEEADEDREGGPEEGEL